MPGRFAFSFPASTEGGRGMLTCPPALQRPPTRPFPVLWCSTWPCSWHATTSTPSRWVKVIHSHLGYFLFQVYYITGRNRYLWNRFCCRSCQIIADYAECIIRAVLTFLLLLLFLTILLLISFIVCYSFASNANVLHCVAARMNYRYALCTEVIFQIKVKK